MGPKWVKNGVLGNFWKILSLGFFVNNLRKEERDQVDFLHVDKYQRLLQIDTTVIGGHGQAC